MAPLRSLETFSKMVEKSIVLVYRHPPLEDLEIDASYRLGHGVVINSSGTIATVNHLFKNWGKLGDSVVVRLLPKDCAAGYFVAEISFLENDHDFCLLRIVKPFQCTINSKSQSPSYVFEAAKLATKLGIGQSIHLVASNDGVNFEYVGGTVAHNHRIGGQQFLKDKNQIPNASYIQVHNTHTLSGFSGCPVFDSKRHVVGLVSYGIGQMDFLVPWNVIKNFCDKMNVEITSLLNAHLSQQEPYSPMNDKHRSLASESTSNAQTSQTQGRCLGNDTEKQTDSIAGILREIPGNGLCAECSAPEPEWASLNLGILMCVECSGAHRNLGVHISKVRSITLDVKVWEPTILELFRGLGNDYCNLVWEELLSPDKDRSDKSAASATSIVKPSSHDSFNKKEKYIQMKYAEKQLIVQKPGSFASHASALWEAVKASNLRETYHLIAVSDPSILNTTYGEIQSAESSRLEESLSKDGHNLDPSACPRLKPGEPENCLRGCSLLHLACHVGNAVMVELLMQSGADVNMRDFHGRTPLHHCIAKKDNELAKYILRRGARRLIKDWGGLTALERAMELGSITDEQLFILLAENE